MDKSKDGETPASPASADVEIDAMAERLSMNWGRSAASPRSAGSQILQRMAHGRMHVVALEIKRSRRRPDGAR